MKTGTGFEVVRPLELLRGFVRNWYPMYDGVEVPEGNHLRIVEIALSTMLNSRISGNTGAEIWRRSRVSVESALSGIPAGLDLLDVPGSSSIPGEGGISQAVSAMCCVPRCKLSVATKILYKKRPGLIPIFDSLVERHYWPVWCPTRKDRSWGDYAVDLTRCFHRDLLSVATEIRELRKVMAEDKTPLSGSRILNILIWAVRSNNEQWLRTVSEGSGNDSADAQGTGTAYVRTGR